MATDYFLLLDGIKGESLDDKHKDEIQLQSWSWGMTQTGSFSYGSGGGAGKVAIQDVHFTKFLDVATSPILKHVTTGKHIATGKLTARKSGDTAPIDYLVVEFKDIIITSYQTGGSVGGDDVPLESLSIGFAEFKITYSKQDNKGVAAKQSAVSWNVQTNKST